SRVPLCLLTSRPPPTPTLLPYTTLFRSLIRKRNQILLLRQDIRSHTAVSLPAVRAAVLALTGNVISPAAIVAHAASGDVVYDHAVAFLKSSQAFAFLHDQDRKSVV